MILDRLTISNFRQFKDKEVIVFSRDEQSNITLILGDNTSGKTTILQAFLWCLYGKTKFSRNEKLFNEHNAYLMKEGEKSTVSVVLELFHLGHKFTIERTQECIKKDGQVSLKGRHPNVRVIKVENGETIEVPQHDIQNTIKEILPEDLSEYFFYDTERFGNVTEKKDVTDAVKGLLGLKILENAIGNLGTRRSSGSVINSFYQEIDINDDDELNTINKNIDIKETEIMRHKENLKQYDSEIKKYTQIMTEEEERLKDYEETEKIKERLDHLRKQRNILEAELQDQYDRFLKDYDRNSLSYFISPLIKKAEEFLVNTKVNDEFISGIDSSSIDDIIERGYCVCGTKIEENSSHYKKLKETLEFIPPQSLGVMVNTYKNSFQHYLDSSKGYYSTIDDTYKKITELSLNIGNISDEIESYEEKIGDFEKTKSIKDNIDRCRDRIDHNTEQKYRTEQDLKHLKDDLEELNRKATKLIELDERNRELLELLTYAEKVKEWFVKDYEERQDIIREELEKRVNQYFKEIYHGNRFVRISPNYKVELYSTNDNREIITDESTGLETVKNFSFIAGLVDLAKEKLDKNKTKYDIQYNLEEEYPLVLDAPFSNVDEKHVINISRVLPSVAGQLILIVMDKDWNYAAEELEYRVGAQYRLNKISEIHTTIVE